jgi:hypothetical protein
MTTFCNDSPMGRGGSVGGRRSLEDYLRFRSLDNDTGVMMIIDRLVAPRSCFPVIAVARFFINAPALCGDELINS